MEVWPHGKENLNKFLDHLNNQNDNIRFIMETKLLFHDRFPDKDEDIIYKLMWDIVKSLTTFTPCRFPIILSWVICLLIASTTTRKRRGERGYP